MAHIDLLRQRFRRLVPLAFLAQATAANPADGGSICATRIQICFLRRTLAGAPFAVVTSYGGGYGLFPADDVEVEARRRGNNYRLRRDVLGDDDGRWQGRG